MELVVSIQNISHPHSLFTSRIGLSTYWLWEQETGDCKTSRCDDDRLTPPLPSSPRECEKIAEVRAHLLNAWDIEKKRWPSEKGTFVIVVHHMHDVLVVPKPAQNDTGLHCVIESMGSPKLSL